MGTEIPISETGLFASQLPRAATGEAPGTPPASQTHARDAHREHFKEIKTCPSQHFTPLITKGGKMKPSALPHPLKNKHTDIYQVAYL